ncbi:hypothetical protein JJB11_16120 [Ramlibacter ginsenosidimutans]|uniref:Uncharacterized protein n=1 Tax=Ramlibacter ginsenosidimutans TaxID=502333 RepID=A0A934WNF2_9BURK|nr:hypothetical protein [Ramlibacter ginsenosidimutans]MBK6007626.1 hypothetical protein [Ramlibacter ginsenosidimutans]
MAYDIFQSCMLVPGLSRSECASWVQAWGSLIAIGAAFIVGNSQIRVARKHASIAARPHLDWGTDRVPGRPVRLYIVNSGLGPAIINSIVMTYKGQAYPVESLDLPERIEQEAREVVGCAEWNMFSPGSVIPAGARIALFIFERKDIGFTTHEDALSFLDRLGLEIRYSSLYGDSFAMTRTARPE